MCVFLRMEERTSERELDTEREKGNNNVSNKSNVDLYIYIYKLNTYIFIQQADVCMYVVLCRAARV